MATNTKTQKETLAEHSAILEQLSAAVTALARSQQQLVELIESKHPLTAGETHEQENELEALAKCKRVTVIHAGTEPQSFTWNAAHRFTFMPGINKEVPSIFAQMYKDWQRATEEAKERAGALAERKTYEAQSRLLAQSKTPMR